MNAKQNSTQEVKPERIAYRFEVLDWGIVTRMLVTPSDYKQIIKEPHVEFTELAFVCKMTSPVIEGVTFAEVVLVAEPQMEVGQLNFSPNDIGDMRILRKFYLSIRCHVSQRLLDTVLAASSAGKISHLLIFGDKLIKSGVPVYDLSISTNIEHMISYA